MNPAIQTQIFDPLTQKFVQVDGGEIATTSLLFQILVELRINNQMLQESVQGIANLSSLDDLRKDLLNEPSFTRQA